MNYDSSHVKVANDGIIKFEILKILFVEPCTRRDLRWKLGQSGYKVSAKTIDYHLRRVKKGLINEGIVREDKRLLYPIFDSVSLPKIIRYASTDPKIEARFNEDVSYAFQNAWTFLDRDIEGREREYYKKISEDANNKRIENIEDAIDTILKAYEFDIFLDRIIDEKANLSGATLNYASISPTSGLFNKIRHHYEDQAIQRIRTDLLKPALEGTRGWLGIYGSQQKSELLSKIYDVASTLWHIENTHLDIVSGKLRDRAETLYFNSKRTKNLKDRKIGLLEVLFGPKVLR